VEITMKRNGYPVELAIAILVMAAFLYLHDRLPASPKPPATATAPQAVVK
jgi:hypothetical protein